ncbi:MAG: tRNA (guanosine(37)-N1)-methyltransferase TrmD [Acholeplasmatales bacterium]|jgi:tRNA (guanine37-N1)-methyltransferase|nr:tRNA (guanosine(37)-N1)-methyltransferase TrmD [Acholeplasmatales bacterium]
MKIDIITIFPEMFTCFLNNSIISRAIKDNKIIINIVNLRDFSHNKHKTIDDSIYGGGAGMLMQFPPIYDAVASLKTDNSKIIYLSPQGKVFNQKKAIKLSKENHLIFICGHYEGIDARVLEIVDYEISIGDYVLTGGELPVMAVVDSITRLLDGVITKESQTEDSLYNGLLKYPQYTKPKEYKGYEVPPILLSGNHEKIDEYREYESIKNTFLKRRDLLKNKKLTSKQEKMLENIKHNL